MMVKLQDFKVGDLFNVVRGNVLNKVNQINGDIPFIGASSTNNGITAYIANNRHLHPAGAITVAANGSVGQTFLQDKTFWASGDINVLYPKYPMSTETKLYIMTAIKKLRVKYSYTFKWTRAKLINDKIVLPVTSNGTPDWQYMHDYIAELERDRIAELERYLQAAGLDNSELTAADKAVLNQKVKTKEFEIGNLFTFDKGNVDIQNKNINNKGCYFINSGLTNQGIKGKTNYPAKIFPANTITIDFFGNAFYRDFEYKLATHNHVFSLSSKYLNEKRGLYLASAMKFLVKKYSYDNMATIAKLKKEAIKLPVNDSEDIDWQYMEQYIKATEKLVISKVVAYKDRVINATAKAVNQQAN